MEALSQEEKPDMDLLLSKLNDKSLSIIGFSDAANHVIVTILERTNHPRSAHAAHHSSPDPAEVNCQKRIQALRDQLKQATALTPQSTLDDTADQLRRERQNLDRLRTQKRNQKFLHATGAAQPQAQDPKTPQRKNDPCGTT